jgi:hypothetical protein
VYFKATKKNSKIMKYGKLVTEEFSASAGPMCYLSFLHLHLNILLLDISKRQFYKWPVTNNIIKNVNDM